MSTLLDEAFKLSPSAWVNSLGLLQDRQGNTSVILDDIQRQILDSSQKRIILCCHRQFGKSSLSSLLCFHQALFYPRSLCLLIAPSLRQSSENFRKILDSLDCIEPRIELVEDTKLTLKMPNSSRIVSLPGSEKTIRGFSAPSLIIEDEAAQASDELFQALYPMLLSNAAGRMILCSTPRGCRGHFYKIWSDETNSDTWMKIEVRASDNARIAPEALEEAKNQLGE